MSKKKKINVKDKSQVQIMFDGIAHNYDFLNHFLTLNIDQRWRKKAIGMLSKKNCADYIDVACGTGDLALAINKRLRPKSIIGVDISEGMLEYGRKKIEKKGLAGIITFRQENCEDLSFADNMFDSATIGFGIRNFQNPEKGLDEIYRVLKHGGELVVLEFSMPKSKIFTRIYNLYFKYVLPKIGRIFSKHNFAYTYLPESVKQFPYGEEFANMMRESGFKDVVFKPLTFGIATAYKGIKK